MKQALAWSALAFAVAQPALGREAVKPVVHPAPASLKIRPLPQDFDLSRFESDGAAMIDREAASPRDPEMPQGTDLRLIAWEPPSFEVELNQEGAVLAFGAMGANHKGMPKLAHVGIDWDF